MSLNIFKIIIIYGGRVNLLIYFKIIENETKNFVFNCSYYFKINEQNYSVTYIYLNN